ncbi:MAG: endonuclease VIII [Cyanophyceae cyanobacterium]
MPEGPEIRRAADRIERAIAGPLIEDVQFAFDHLQSYESDLIGQRVLEVETRGKAMLTHFDNGLSIYSHNQLYGVWMIRKKNNFPQTRRQLRLAIHGDEKMALLYSASSIEVLDKKGIKNHSFLGGLGPDVMNKRTQKRTLSNRLIKQLEKHKRRQLCGSLLDQKMVCGIGNYLRSEILFLAKLHPSRRPVDCTKEELKSLVKLMISVPEQSYKTGGITNDLKRAEQLKAQGARKSHYRHWVFARKNQPCYVCGETIIKSTFAGRRCYHCPRCQKL